MRVPLPAEMTSEVAQYFRSQLREARAQVLRDSEAFEPIVLVLERIGRVLRLDGNGLGKFEAVLGGLAAASPLAHDLPNSFPHYHLGFRTLFDLVREGRNTAVHEGALARHVTNHAVELALILEDALMPTNNTVAEFMVRGPTTVAPWHPLSFVRQAMLANSYSYLPVKLEAIKDQPWRLVSDVAVAEYLRAAGPSEREKRLRTSVRDAAATGSLRLDTPRCIAPEHSVSDLVANLTSVPSLVVGDGSNELMGILTAFDLL